MKGMQWLTWPRVLGLSLASFAVMWMTGYWLLMDVVGDAIPVREPHARAKDSAAWKQPVLGALLLMSLISGAGVLVLKTIDVALRRMRKTAQQKGNG